MTAWSKRLLGFAILALFTIQLGCEYTGEVVGVKKEGVYYPKSSKFLRKYEEHEKVYFACKEDADQRGYKPSPKSKALMKKSKAEKKAEAKAAAAMPCDVCPAAKTCGTKAVVCPCDTCPMKDTCDRKPGPYMGPVTGVKKSMVYHTKDCPCVQQLKGDEKQEFKCKKEAAAAGYKPCQECEAFKEPEPAKKEEAKPAATPAKQPEAKPAAAPVKKEEAKPAAAPAKKEEAKPAAAPAKKEEAKPAAAPAKKEEPKPAPAPAPKKEEAKPKT